MCENRTKGLIYIIDDEAPMRVIIAKYLQKMGYDVQVFIAGSDVVVECQKKLPDLLISDILMPEMNGVELVEAIRPIAPNLPVLCMSGYATESTKENLMKLGIKALLKKPVSFEVLKQNVETAIAQNCSQPTQTALAESKSSLKILIVDDNKTILEMERDFLETCGHIIDVCTDGKQALELMVLNQYDVVLLDIVLPGISGLEVLKSIKIHDRNQPVIMITGEANSEIIADCEAITGDPCLRKPIDLHELQKRIESFNVNEFRYIRHKKREHIRSAVVRKMETSQRRSYEKQWQKTYVSKNNNLPLSQSNKLLATLIIVSILIGLAIGFGFNKKTKPPTKALHKQNAGQMDIMKEGLKYLYRDEVRELERDAR